jgi:hypothetical protein
MQAVVFADRHIISNNEAVRAEMIACPCSKTYPAQKPVRSGNRFADEEAAFAKLCGACPIPASSGRTNRHRLNRGGNRQANAALYRVVIVRMRNHQPTLDYVKKRKADGKGKMEIIRCLKRFVAREIFGYLCGAQRSLTSLLEPT